MPDLFFLLSKWWKHIFFFVLLSLIAAGVVLFLKPRLYLSVATSLPASSVSSDKARIFNENIQELYSGMGSSDDLDRILGTARLDTVYLAITDQFNLFDHYKISAGNKNARSKAARKLKCYSRVIKSDYGELQVKVWDTDKDLAPQLANSIMAKLEEIHSNLQSNNNMAALNSLAMSRLKIRDRIDSIDKRVPGTTGTSEIEVMHRKILIDQLQENEKLFGEYQMMIDNKPSVLMIVEKAKAAIVPDKPRYIQVLAATALISLFFAFLLAIALERKKTKES